MQCHGVTALACDCSRKPCNFRIVLWVVPPRGGGWCCMAMPLARRKGRAMPGWGSRRSVPFPPSTRQGLTWPCKSPDAAAL
eukprot:846745-Alexandrium_andersonii.AAC.1